MATTLTIEPDALAMIIDIRDNEPGDGEFALRMDISGIQGLQFEYELAFVPVADAGDDDVVERHGELAVIHKERDLPNLDGATLKIGEAGLSIDNPNTPSPVVPGDVPGDLEGPLAEQVAQMLETQINPAIAAHGGAARLVSIDENNIAYLELLGGCQGCGLAAVTLKQGIERSLMEAIPELAGVADLTDHASGQNPYYQQSKK
jgi:Fe/S biogenesis protein NfuA